MKQDKMDLNPGKQLCYKVNNIIISIKSTRQIRHIIICDIAYLGSKQDKWYLLSCASI